MPAVSSVQTALQPAPTLASSPARRSFAFHRNASFASLLLGYSGYYLCRRNFSAAMPVLEGQGFDTTQLGWVVTIGTLAYALGKVTTGSLADSKGGRFAFFAGLAGAVVASFLIGIGPASVVLLAALWAVNNYFQSMGWGGIVNVLGRWYPKKDYGTAMGVVSISYLGGAAIALACAGQLVAWKLGWRALFLVPSVALAGIGLALLPFLKGRPEEAGHEPLDSLRSLGDTEKGSLEDSEKSTYWSRFVEVLSDKKFLVMCALSFVLTLLRACFDAWLPSYFKSLGSAGAAGILKSTAFPILGCIGTLAAGWLSDRVFAGRRAPIMASFLAAAAVSLVALAKLDALVELAHVLGAAIDRTNVACAVSGVTGFFLLGSYSLVGGVAALDFGARRTAGTAAGLLDGVGYLGATLAGVGVAEAVKNVGWAGAYGVMAVLAVVGVVICGFLWNVKPK